MAGPTVTFSLQGSTIIFGGVRITGFGTTDAVTAKRSGPRWTITQCCDGGVVRSQRHAEDGEVSITLRYDSTAHRHFKTKADAAESVGLTIEWPNGRVLESGDAVVLEDPELKFGEATGDETWKLHANPLDVIYEPGGGRSA
jgi:uncharacterized protein YodC (DUF2158 family)